VRPEVHEVTSTSEVTGELMAAHHTAHVTAETAHVAAETAHVTAETAPVAAASPTSAGERGRRKRET
jgi:hypothetical protein